MGGCKMFYKAQFTVAVSFLRFKLVVLYLQLEQVLTLNDWALPKLQFTMIYWEKNGNGKFVKDYSFQNHLCGKID